MKKILQLILLFLFIGNMGFTQTLLLQESFEVDASNYDANTFTDDISDYFLVHSNGATPPSGFTGTLSNIDGTYFFAGEDLDAIENPVATEGYIVLSSQDISAYSEVQVTVALAIGTLASFESADPDGIKIQYAFDGNIATTGDDKVNTGTYTTIGEFACNLASGAPLSEDTNFDGTGDGTALSNAFQDFTFSFPTNGATNVSIRIVADCDGSEEIAIDNIRISGIATTTAPTVTTAPATSISTTSATLGGNVTSDGGEAVSERGAVYSKTDATPTIAEGATKDANGSGTGTFSESIGSLDVNTTYYYNAYAINSEGTSYGTSSSFTTLKLSQTITFGALSTKTYGDADFTPGATASSGLTVTYSSSNTAVATIVSGNIHIVGAGSCTIYADQAGSSIYYTASQESQSLTINKATPTVTVWPTAAGITYGEDLSLATLSGGTASVAGSFAYDDNTITPNAGTYSAAVTFAPTDANNYNAVKGNIDVTVNKPPTVTTQAVSAITQTTAMGNGNITDLGYPNPTQHGVCWNTEGTPTTSNSKTEEGAVSVTEAFTSDITGLSSGTMYYVRAYATNSSGTTYGSEVSFTTLEPATVTTQAVTSITSTTATANGNITNLGVPNPTQHGVCWSTSTNPTISGSKTEEGAVAVTGAFTSDITGLSSGTMHYVRAYATNSSGTTYGSEVSFTALEPATVTTQAVTSITSTTATANGNITNLGVPNPTQHGFCYNKTGSPSLFDSHVDMGAVSATSTFSTTIYFLNPNTTYYLKAYATNTAEIAYGDEVSFTTLAEVPTATTNTATNLSGSGATLNGTVNANNASTTITFEYGLTTAYGTSATADQSPVTGTSDTDVSAALTELEPNTTYHYRVVGVNAGGTTYGSDQSFATNAIAPSVTTTAATNITAKRVTFNGIVNTNNASTNVFIQMGTTTAYGIVSEVNQSPVTGSSDVLISYTANGYTPNTTYHYRLVGVNAGGTTYGEDVTFTTLTQKPIATTLAASSVGATSITLNGTVNANELSTDVTFEYGLTDSYGTIVSADQSPLAEGYDEDVSTTITGLIPNTIYHFRVVGDNTEGTDYGDDMTFTTSTVDPTITTTNTTAITANSATLNGSVNPNDYSTTVTFEYGLTTAYGSTITADQSPVTGNTEQSVSAVITGLSPYTTYHFRVVGESSAGEANGDDITFTTSPVASTVTTQAVTNITKTTATGNGNITDLGIPNPTTHGVCWNTTGTPTTEDSYSDEGAASTTGAFTSDIISLIPNTTYYVRAYATNTAGTVYGDEISFKSLSQDPTTTTIAASEVEVTAATLNGTVNANDFSTTVTFEYGLTTAYGTTITADESPITGTTYTDVSAVLTGLSPNTTYHFRVKGESGGGSATGSDLSLTTDKYSQTITFDALADKTTDDDDFAPGATSNLGLDISYSSNNEQVATIVDNQIHIIGAGTIEITASQNGNDTVYAATPASQNLIVTEATGIDDLKSMGVKLYPNPTADILTIEIDENYFSDKIEVSIIDLKGSVIYSSTLTRSLWNINVSDYPQGLYIIQINNQKEITKHKLLIE